MPAPDALVTAYRNTDYRVAAGSPFTLRIGEASPQLASCFRQTGTKTAAFITACNPASHLLSPGDNAQRQLALLQTLQQLGLQWLPGRGEDPSGQWPGEDSVLVLGIEKEKACELGRLFGQYAIVFCNAGSVPELVWL